MEETLFQEIENLLTKAYDARVNNPAHSVTLAAQAVQLSKELNADLHAKALTQLGLFQMIMGDFNTATDLSKEALAHFEKVNDLKGIAAAKYNIGSVYYKTDNFHIGLQYMLECLQIYRELNDKHNEGRVLKSIGTIYEYFGDEENAISSYQKSISAAEIAEDLNQISNAYNPLSGIYLKQGNHELALSFIEKSISIKEKTKDIRGLAFAYYGRGKIYLKQKKYDKALSDLNHSMEMQQEMGDKLGEGMVYNKLGQLFMAQRNFSDAETCFFKALKVSEGYNIQFVRFKVQYNLYLLAREQGDTQSALQHLERYVALKEIVINTRTFDVIKSYEAIAKIESLEREAKAQRDKSEIIEKKNAELDSFFYRISHDLKGPISSLLGLFNLVKLDVKDPMALKYFDMCQSQIHRINNIVVDLINLTRMNHAVEAKSKINFDMLVNECIMSYSYVNNFKRINFVKKIDETLTFNSEWGIVNTIVQNLIENAIKYAKKDGEDPYVGVFIMEENKWLKIQVVDNGQGILEDYQPKIFDMFFRANDITQGTGLGLYILKRAVERLKGKISFRSEINIGSSFTVLLPF